MSDGRAFGLSPYVTESFVVRDSNQMRKNPMKTIDVYEANLEIGSREASAVLPTKKKCSLM